MVIGTKKNKEYCSMEYQELRRPCVSSSGLLLAGRVRFYDRRKFGPLAY